MYLARGGQCPGSLLMPAVSFVQWGHGGPVLCAFLLHKNILC